MILSKDTPAGKGKNQEPKEGERTKARKRFNDVAEVSKDLQTKLLKVVVHLDFSNRAGIGSGVILNAEQGNDVAYVLTAKHLLYKWADVKSFQKTPAQIVTKDFISRIKVYYNPPEFEKQAQTAAQVSEILYTASDNKTWDYDIMVLKVVDKAFHTFVTTNGFMSKASAEVYQPLLEIQDDQSRLCLNKGEYVYLQMGYGTGRDKSIPETLQYEEFKGRIQCRWTAPKAKEVAKKAFDVDKTRNAVSDALDIILLDASNVSSTGEGDSGGPLFAIPKKDRTKFFLLGVTTGGNYLVDNKYRQNPKSAPDDTNYYNNASTFWGNVFDEWVWA